MLWHKGCGGGGGIYWSAGLKEPPQENWGLPNKLVRGKMIIAENLSQDWIMV